MKPAEILQGLVDGVIKFLQNYLRFLILSLFNPLLQASKQFYRSEVAAEKDISALSYLFVSIFLASFIRFNLFDVFMSTSVSVHDRLKEIVRNTNADSLFPVIVGALAMTIVFDFYIFILHRRGMRDVRRSRRLYSIIILIAASSVFWSHVADWIANLLGWIVFVCTPLHTLFKYDLNLDMFWFTHFASYCGQTAQIGVSFAFFLPLAAYIGGSKHSKKRFLNQRIWYYGFPVYLTLVLLAFREVRFYLADQLEGGVEISDFDCDTRILHQPISGTFVVTNSSSSERLIRFNQLAVLVEDGEFENFAGVTADMNASRSSLIVEGKQPPEPIILKVNESKLVHYQTLKSLEKTTPRNRQPDDNGAKCVVNDLSSTPL